jgi:hypothetical protein
MNSLEKAQELIQNGKNVPKRTLFTAYIAFHIENPTYHPDDCLRNDDYSPYKGWEVVLINDALRLEPPETVEYPTAFLKISELLDGLDVLHTDIYADSLLDEDSDMVDMVLQACDFFKYMDTKNLHMGYEALQKLYLYHASENDTAEEEAEKPAGVLKTCADTLTWIAQQENV